MAPRPDPFVKPGQPPTAAQPVAASVVVVACPSCGRAVTVAAVLAGRNVACPVCSAPFVVPASQANEAPIVATLAASQGEPQEPSRRWMAIAGVAFAILCGCCTLGAGVVMLADTFHNAIKVSAPHR